MKRLFLLFAIACVGLASCSENLSEDDPNNPNEEVGENEEEYSVKFKVDMRVPELKEDVVAATDEKAIFYKKFYATLITSGLAIPNDYILTFKKDGEIVGEYKGTFGEEEIVLPNGRYTVTGQCDGDFNHASFSIDDEVVVDKNTSVLRLKSCFACWIFTFDRQAFSHAWRCNGETPGQLTYLNKTDDFFYVFNTSEVRLPFILGYSTNCDDLHDQIKYTDDNIWHLGLTWQDADKNYPAEVWYCPSVGDMLIGDFYHANKDGRVRHIDLIWTTE